MSQKPIILITGYSGMIAQRLILSLEKTYQIRSFSTNDKHIDGKNVFHWNPSQGEYDQSAFDNIFGIIHLSGYPIIAKWTESNIKKMKDSRIKALELLMRGCAESDVRPEVMISASAIGFYGYGRKGAMDEFRSAGSGFVAELCQKWEDSALAFEAIGTRVVIPRISLVLSNTGGFIQEMKPIYKLGLGSALGDGKQAMPWIHIDDICQFIVRSLNEKSIQGPFNMSSPEEPSLDEFGKILAKILKKPYFMPKVPRFVLKIFMGERSQLLLDTPSITPMRLKEIDFKYHFPQLEEAIQNVI